MPYLFGKDLVKIQKALIDAYNLYFEISEVNHYWRLFSAHYCAVFLSADDYEINEFLTDMKKYCEGFIKNEAINTPLHF